MFRSRAGRLLALMGATTLLLSCAPYNVRTDYDDEVSFSQFRTFAWMDTTRRRDDETDNPFLERRVKRAVETVMARSCRAWVLRTTSVADLVLTNYRPALLNSVETLIGVA